MIHQKTYLKNKPGKNKTPFFSAHPKIQTKCVACEKDDKVQSKSKNGGGIATNVLTTKLNNTKGGGSPLLASTNQFMNNAFGNDFSGVRVHTGSNSIQMNQGLNARAFTHGSDVYFNKGEYSPNPSEGKRLLRHELAHVVQQSGVKPKIQRNSTKNIQKKPLGRNMTGIARLHEDLTRQFAQETGIPYRSGLQYTEGYRRWLVSGSHGASGGNTVGGATHTSSATTTCNTPVCFNCVPQPVSFNRFTSIVNQNNLSQDAFGITVLSGHRIQTPSIALNTNGRLIATSCSATIPSFFIGSGEIFPDSGGRRPTNRNSTASCRSSIIHFGITPSGASQIAAAESEHCQDFQRAFILTFGNYTNEINRLARRRRRFRNIQQAEQVLDRRVGIPFSQLGNMFVCLAEKTRLRDTRGSHTPSALSAATLFPTQRHCRFPLVRITGSNLPGIGTISSASLIRGCNLPSIRTRRRP